MKGDLCPSANILLWVNYWFRYLQAPFALLFLGLRLTLHTN